MLVWVLWRNGTIREDMNAEFQRIARRDKKAFLSNQCKEIEENNRMGPGPGQAVAGLVLAVFGGRAGVSRLECGRGSCGSRGTFGGRRKAVRDRLALQGGTGDFP